MARVKNFKEELLQRDGHRCIVSGDMDVDHWESLDRPSDIAELSPTEGAHIIPFSYAVCDPKRVCSRIFTKILLLTGLERSLIRCIAHMGDSLALFPWY